MPSVPGSAAVLVALRQRMEAQGLDALVIPSEGQVLVLVAECNSKHAFPFTCLVREKVPVDCRGGGCPFLL